MSDERKVMEYIQTKIAAAIDGSLTDATIYGAGYIRVSCDATGNMEVVHVPFNELDEEFERVREHRKLIV
jgi:hypothetical protein